MWSSRQENSIGSGYVERDEQLIVSANRGLTIEGAGVFGHVLTGLSKAAPVLALAKDAHVGAEVKKAVKRIPKSVRDAVVTNAISALSPEVAKNIVDIVKDSDPAAEMSMLQKIIGKGIPDTQKQSARAKKMAKLFHGETDNPDQVGRGLGVL